MKVFIGKYRKTKKQRVFVHIDNYDVWNMDTTLAHIILPMLKKIRLDKMGAPFVDDEDVPEHLRRKTDAERVEYETDDNWFVRWDYVLGEMIFAFESQLNDWEDQFWKTPPQIDFSQHPEDEGKFAKPVRWLQEGDCDWDGVKEYEKRIQNGFRLFGKYYNGLWT